MVDWEKERTFYEKLIVDFAYKRDLKLLRYIMKKILRGKIGNAEKYKFDELTVHCVGNSHLDSAWKWRKSDTREKKVHPTFSRNVYHLTQEPIPRYTFTANATVHYEWIKKDFPNLFEQIRELVLQDRWEPVGGEYVEPDCNIPNGESLIRQRLIGQRFYIREFGEPAKVAWMDDVFGWPNSMPQIFRKSGSTYFYTNKFCYSEYSVQFNEDSEKYAGKEKFPFFHFRWQSPDGSQILCTWAQHKNNFNKHLKHFHEHSRTVKTKEDNTFHYGLSWQEMDEKCTDEIVPLIMDAYGKGDGGMGPTSLEIVEKLAWEDVSREDPVVFTNGTAEEFMKKLTQFEHRLPVWDDELYLEGHRGTLTSISMIKENNHTLEVLLNGAESLSVFSGLVGADHFGEELVKDWKMMLFLQFHDVLPGSSIAEVYRDAADDYKSVIAHLFSIQEAGLTNIAHTLKEEIKKNIISIYNPLGWERQRGAYLTIFRKNFNAVLDPETAPLHVQRVSTSPYVRNREGHLGIKKVPGHEYLKNPHGKEELYETLNKKQDHLLVYIPPGLNLGAFGIQNLYLLSKGGRTGEGKNNKFTETDTHYEFQNNYYYIKITKSTGKISHVSAAASEGKENVLGNEGICYKLYRDEKTNFDAWNIDIDFKDKLVPFPPVKEISIEEDGPLRHTLLIKYKKTKAGSTLYSKIMFYRNDPKIYGETLVDWQEDHKLLKLMIDTRFGSESVECGNPYGIQKRSTKPRTVYQEAMIEFAFQQFATWRDPSIDYGGFQKGTFYSQTKYGMSMTGGTPEISLLKAAKFDGPDKKYATLDEDYGSRCEIIDHGFHRIPWAIEFSDQSKTLLDTIKTAYEYNFPVVAAPTGVKHPNISFLSIDQPNVLISSVKEMEKWMREAPDWFYKPQMSELPFVVRLVEHEGKESQCTLTCHDLIQIKKIFEVDLLERVRNHGIKNSDVELEGQKIIFTIKPYEIKSILIVGRRPLED